MKELTEMMISLMEAQISQIEESQNAMVFTIDRMYEDNDPQHAIDGACAALRAMSEKKGEARRLLNNLKKEIKTYGLANLGEERTCSLNMFDPRGEMEGL